MTTCPECSLCTRYLPSSPYASWLWHPTVHRHGNQSSTGTRRLSGMIQLISMGPGFQPTSVCPEPRLVPQCHAAHRGGNGDLGKVSGIARLGQLVSHAQKSFVDTGKAAEAAVAPTPCGTPFFSSLPPPQATRLWATGPGVGVGGGCPVR